MVKRLLYIAVILICQVCTAYANPAVQTFTVRDYLHHQWTDELVHFNFDVPAAKSDFTLADSTGAPVLSQMTNCRSREGRMKGTAWTVISVPADGCVSLHLREGRSTAPPGVVVTQREDTITIRNDRCQVSLCRWPGKLTTPVDLAKLPGPFISLRRPDGNELCSGEWVNDGPPLPVVEADTTVVERGPVRAVVKQTLKLAGGGTYSFTILLAARQDVALITEHSDIDAPKAGLRLSFDKLQPDHVFWYNNFWQTSGKVDTAPDFSRESTICKLRPWSFWWTDGITEWAEFYKNGSEPFVSLLMLRPSRWSPYTWTGFDRTEVPVIARPGGHLQVTMGLLALKEPAGATQPLHREWALTVGKMSDQVSDDPNPKQRYQLIKYSEFPLDEVKDYRFDFSYKGASQTHPCLLFTQQDLARVRKQAQQIASVKEACKEAEDYLRAAGGLQIVLKNEGWQTFYTRCYLGCALSTMLPQAYIATGKREYGEMLAAAVKGQTRAVLDTFLEHPSRPAIGDYGPWFADDIMLLLFNYDLIAATGLLSPEDEAAALHALVFCAHFLSHPDFWNVERGCCSANPNMTSLIVLPRGLLGLFLVGHPESPMWLSSAEQELKREMKEWVSPGGAWIENPGYQVASMDGMFILSQAIMNIQGRDYFKDPQFKSTMDYYGFILTPPDRRFPPGKPDELHPMTQPSIGDGFSGFITCFNGWMAAATAKSDPQFSARQQFYWRAQNWFLGSAGRARGLTLALTDGSLNATPPDITSRGFPGFGSIMRTSWTDPRASYVAHRTGPNLAHYHDDFNSFVYYAKGAPLCVDFGNCYAPNWRTESWYHNRVSFDKEGSIASILAGKSSIGSLVEMDSLPNTLDYSCGNSHNGAELQDQRHILLVKSRDPMGANYIVMRDTTGGGGPDSKFYWNLWCLSGEPAIGGSVVHFPGQLGVDLDVHVLSPAAPQIEKDHWSWKEQIYVWGDFAEEQYGMRITKQGSAEDFLSVLYPRVKGQGQAQVTPLANGAGLKVIHMEGTDWLLFSPQKAASSEDSGVSLSGEVAFARRYDDGKIRLAVVKGQGSVGLDGWSIRSSGPVAVEITGDKLAGESTGEAHEALLTLPPGRRISTLMLDGKPIKPSHSGSAVGLMLPGGSHKFVALLR